MDETFDVRGQEPCEVRGQEVQNDEALRRFRVHPKHKELTDILSGIADRQVGDILSTLPVRKPPQVKDLDLMYFDPRN